MSGPVTVTLLKQDTFNHLFIVLLFEFNFWCLGNVLSKKISFLACGCPCPSIDDHHMAVNSHMLLLKINRLDRSMCYSGWLQFHSVVFHFLFYSWINCHFDLNTHVIMTSESRRRCLAMYVYPTIVSNNSFEVIGHFYLFISDENVWFGRRRLSPQLISHLSAVLP